jgi:5-methylcytosine-specific restriction endonuclease McrA
LNRAKEYRKQNKEEISEKKKRYRVENPDAVRLANQRLQRRFSIAKYRAKKHGMDFKLSFDDYSKVVSDGLCHYCGKEIPKSGSGLDRKNEERFYAVENCVPCCCRCNTAFMANFTYEEKLVIAAAIKTVDERRARLNEDVT